MKIYVLTSNNESPDVLLVTTDLKKVEAFTPKENAYGSFPDKRKAFLVTVWLDEKEIDSFYYDSFMKQ